MTPDAQAISDALAAFLDGDQLAAAVDAVVQAISTEEGAEGEQEDMAAEADTGEESGEYDAFKAGQAIFPKE